MTVLKYDEVIKKVAWSRLLFVVFFEKSYILERNWFKTNDGGEGGGGSPTPYSQLHRLFKVKKETRLGRVHVSVIVDQNVPFDYLITSRKKKFQSLDTPYLMPG